MLLSKGVLGNLKHVVWALCSDGSGSLLDKRSRVVVPVGLHSGVSQQLTIGFDVGISSGEQEISIEN
jgi:hypothetical protein